VTTPSPDAAEDPPPDEASRWRAGAYWRFLDGMDEFWRSREGQQVHAAEADLQAWLADQPGVVVHSHGGHAPEQWRGQVDFRATSPVRARQPGTLELGWSEVNAVTSPVRVRR
jgi:hypothetical protein